jgi:hypothetical protein
MYVICMVGPGWAALIEYISVLSRSTIFVCIYVCMYACMCIFKKGYNKPFYLEIGKEMGSSAMRSRSFLSAMENVILRRFHYFKWYKNKHMHTYIHTYIFTTVLIHAKILFVVVKFVHTYPYTTYIHTYIHTYIYSHVHTYKIQTYTYIHTTLYCCPFLWKGTKTWTSEWRTWSSSSSSDCPAIHTYIHTY